MKRKIIGLILCILLSCPLLATTSMAVKKADVQIEGGLGVKVTITNVGDEPIKGAPWLEIHKKYSLRVDFPVTNSPGMNDPLQPGESLTWRKIDLCARPLYRIRPGPGIPLFGLITITAFFYQNGETNPVIGEKTIDAVYLCGFVILLLK